MITESGLGTGRAPLVGFLCTLRSGDATHSRLEALKLSNNGHMWLREVNLAEFLSISFQVSICQQGFPRCKLQEVLCCLNIVFHMIVLTY